MARRGCALIPSPTPLSCTCIPCRNVRLKTPPAANPAPQTAQLKAEAARASLLSLATDHGLAGAALAAEVDKLVRLGLRAPNEFWERLMSERSQVIIANSNKHAREKVALERRQAQLQVRAGAHVGRAGVCEGCTLAWGL